MMLKRRKPEPMGVKEPTVIRCEAHLKWCRRCVKERDEKIGGLPHESCRMIVCAECGNKRCPRATDHRLICTRSNEPGQPGSAYA